MDFLRYPPEPTGDEPDDLEFEAPKIYEPVRKNFTLVFLSIVLLLFLLLIPVISYTLPSPLLDTLTSRTKGKTY